MDFCLFNSKLIYLSTILPKTAQPTTICIRSAKTEDIKSLADVLVQSFHPTVSRTTWLSPLLRLGIHEDLRTRLRGNLDDYQCLVALSSDNERILGTVEISLKGWFYHPMRRCYISNLAVNPAHRRQGIARQLLLKCEQVAQVWNCPDLSLHVLENNLAAQALYQSLGYAWQRNELNWQHWLFQKPRRLLLHKQLQCQTALAK